MSTDSYWSTPLYYVVLCVCRLLLVHRTVLCGVVCLQTLTGPPYCIVWCCESTDPYWSTPPYYVVLLVYRLVHPTVLYCVVSLQTGPPHRFVLCCESTDCSIPLYVWCCESTDCSIPLYCVVLCVYKLFHPTVLCGVVSLQTVPSHCIVWCCASTHCSVPLYCVVL